VSDEKEYAAALAEFTRAGCDRFAYLKRFLNSRGLAFGLVPAGLVGSGLIEGCIVNLECRVKDRLETGDHMLFVCSVLEGHVLEEEARVIFTLNDEAFFNHAGQGKGYKFGTFK